MGIEAAGERQDVFAWLRYEDFAAPSGFPAASTVIAANLEKALTPLEVSTLFSWIGPVVYAEEIPIEAPVAAYKVVFSEARVAEEACTSAFVFDPATHRTVFAT